jgi:predicted translin family RNA/ssDNA-binding protein
MNKQYYDAISKSYQDVGNDLQGLDAYRYGRAITGGTQEFVEAISFEHYLETQKLITFDETAEKVSSLGGKDTPIPVTEMDYVLGIYDMTGELMKFAVTAMAMNGEVPTTARDENEMDDGPRRNVLNDLRELRALLQGLSVNGVLAKETYKKMDVMQASVQKVENALYGLIVRGAERPKGWMPEERSNVAESENLHA